MRVQYNNSKLFIKCYSGCVSYYPLLMQQCNYLKMPKNLERLYEKLPKTAPNYLSLYNNEHR